MIVVEKKEDLEYKISSFCTVATKEVKREVLLLCFSIKRLYEGIPIVLLCDKETKLYVSERIKGIIIKEATLKKPSSVVIRSEYHRPDAIAWKMEVMQDAINNFGNSIFLDSDILLLERIFGPSDCNVALSHNLTKGDTAKSVSFDGAFNAGMVWSNLKEFPEWWRKRYLSAGKLGFYEQSILNECPYNFRCAYFDVQHNHGFWRGSLKNREVKSFHCHLDHELDSKMSTWMKPKVDLLRRRILERLKNNYIELYDYYIEHINETDKIYNSSNIQENIR